MSANRNKKLQIRGNTAEFLIYKADDGQVKLDVRLENETIWLTQGDMAQLFGCFADNISLHVKKYL